MCVRVMYNLMIRRKKCDTFVHLLSRIFNFERKVHGWKAHILIRIIASLGFFAVRIAFCVKSGRSEHGLRALMNMFHSISQFGLNVFNRRVCFILFIQLGMKHWNKFHESQRSIGLWRSDSLWLIRRRDMCVCDPFLHSYLTFRIEAALIESIRYHITY